MLKDLDKHIHPNQLIISSTAVATALYRWWITHGRSGSILREFTERNEAKHLSIRRESLNFSMTGSVSVRKRPPHRRAFFVSFRSGNVCVVIATWKAADIHEISNRVYGIKNCGDKNAQFPSLERVWSFSTRGRIQ